MSDRILIVNCATTYNLAVAKLAALYVDATVVQGKPTPMDLTIHNEVYLSAIFSWDLPLLREVAQDAAFYGCKVVAGGPAVLHNRHRLDMEIQETHEAEHVAGDFPMGWTSRGCIRNCPWCILSRRSKGG